VHDNRVRALWRDGGVAVMCGCSIGNTYASEIMAHAGFDALMLDQQHSPVDWAAMTGMIQTIAGSGTEPFVRVPWNSPADIMRALDAGATGIVCPMINSRAECEAFVGACLYAPAGYRSYGPLARYTGMAAGYVAKANANVLPIAMIETVEAVERIDEILSVPGLAGLFIGPSDLSITMGLDPAADFSKPDLLPAIDAVFAAGKRHGVANGISSPTLNDARIAIARGADLVWAGSDASHMRAGARAAMAEMRAHLKR
jgi:4-hydroxy-2-oxoheptanedioate aldolase